MAFEMIKWSLKDEESLQESVVQLVKKKDWNITRQITEVSINE
jgi:hypothetical protein